MGKKEVCKCGHDKSYHSLKTKECLYPQNITGYQDKHWEIGYCTCRKYKEKK